ncbi:hypothetical protein [Hyphomicrobium sp.]|nr:hypothetical protein [Hyphomicrobium sp.]HEX2841067.1 hypothetical protein [Hyphomicrobium sp.]
MTKETALLDDPRHSAEEPNHDPIGTAVFLAVLIAGFLLVHFGAMSLW